MTRRVKAGAQRGGRNALAQAGARRGGRNALAQAGAQRGGRNALVVGGAGRMGRWFCGYFASLGFAVRVHDPGRAPPGTQRVADLAEGLAGLGPKDVVLVSTPMELAGPALEAIHAHGTPALVVDICSVKEPVVVELRRMARAGLKVASLHPMWGPDAVLLSDKNLLVLDCGDRAAVRAAKALFRGTAVSLQELPLTEHDARMAWALSLPHAMNLAFALALRESGLPAKELARLGGPTLRKQLDVARGVSGENKELYHGIQALNPHTATVHEALQRGLDELRAARGDDADFRALMTKAESYFRDPSRTAKTSSAARRRRSR